MLQGRSLKRRLNPAAAGCLLPAPSRLVSRLPRLCAVPLPCPPASPSERWLDALAGPPPAESAWATAGVADHDACIPPCPLPRRSGGQPAPGAAGEVREADLHSDQDLLGAGPHPGRRTVPPAGACRSPPPLKASGPRTHTRSRHTLTTHHDAGSRLPGHAGRLCTGPDTASLDPALLAATVHFRKPAAPSAHFAPRPAPQDDASKLSKGYAFVEYENAEQAKAAQVGPVPAPLQPSPAPCAARRGLTRAGPRCRRGRRAWGPRSPAATAARCCCRPGRSHAAR